MLIGSPPPALPSQLTQLTQLTPETPLAAKAVTKKRGRPKGSTKAVVAAARAWKEANPQPKKRPKKNTMMTPTKNPTPTPMQDLLATSPASCGTPALATTSDTPQLLTIRAETMHKYVAFCPIEEKEIHKNDKKLMAIYAGMIIPCYLSNICVACGSWMLRGCITAVYYVKGLENELDMPTPLPGQKAKAPEKALVAMHQITWAETHFQKHQPVVSFATMVKGMSQFFEMKMNEQFHKNRSYLEIYSNTVEDESHEITEFDMKLLNEEKVKEDVEDVDGGDRDQPADAAIDDSDDDWSEQVDREWKKKGNDTFGTAKDIEACESVKWEFGADFAGPADLFVHTDGTANDELRVLDKFKESFKSPVQGTIYVIVISNIL